MLSIFNSQKSVLSCLRFDLELENGAGREERDESEDFEEMEEEEERDEEQVRIEEQTSFEL